MTETTKLVLGRVDESYSWCAKKKYPLLIVWRVVSSRVGDPCSTPGPGRSTGEGIPTPVFLSCPGGLAGEESAHNAGDPGSIPGLGRSPGGGKGYPLQYSGWENSMDYSPWGHKQLDTPERLLFWQLFWTAIQAFSCLAFDSSVSVLFGETCLVNSIFEFTW